MKYLQDCTGSKFNEHILIKINNLIDDVKKAYNSVALLIKNKYEGTNLINDKDAIEKIKQFLDSMKSLVSFIRCFEGTGQEPDRDEIFDGEFDTGKKTFYYLNNIYNKTRNYVTKKPYSIEKYKLNFDNAELLTGWDLNKETSKASIILKKDNLYYLGIMKKSDRRVFLNVPETESTYNCYEKMEYKLLPGPNKMLPKRFFAKSNIDYYDPSPEIMRIYKEGTFKKGDNFNIDDCHDLIDYFKESSDKNDDWKILILTFRRHHLIRI